MANRNKTRQTYKYFFLISFITVACISAIISSPIYTGLLKFKVCETYTAPGYITNTKIKESEDRDDGRRRREKEELTKCEAMTLGKTEATSIPGTNE